METIEEQSKCEEMSISPTPSPDNLRICLVGKVVDDKLTLDAALTFGVPVITSESGMEIISDTSWITYFILNDFDGSIYDAIHKSKHRIIGPPALQQAVQMKEGLTHSSRPLYNYSMRGVITCFTGIRKKDELTRLVNLIHSMGGSIRKDMNSKVTHLICNTSGGDKYQYAMTFRLAVIRSDWVYEAWNNRDIPNFRAMSEDFSKEHRLKAFEGQKICFFGFATDEHQHMVDVLKNNGGIPTDLEDPECSHVIMANMGAHFPDNIPTSRNSSPNHLIESNEISDNQNINNNLNSQNQKTENNESKDTSENCGENLTSNNYQYIDESPKKILIPDDLLLVSPHKIERIKIEENTTPKTTRLIPQIEKSDGIVLSSAEENAFSELNNISPILSIPTTIANILPVSNNINYENISRIDEEDEDNLDEISSINNSKDLKRKRDSFDNLSILSTDSLACMATTSAKKPKLIRTGSITRSLKRSMSFVAVKTPIANMLRSRRNSIDPNASISSITSIESTFNESIRKPVKEKLRGIRDRITKSSKREINITPKAAKLVTSNLGTLKKLCKIKVNDKNTPVTPERHNSDNNNTDLTDFKTPLVPKTFQSTYRHSVCAGVVSSSNISSSTMTLEEYNHNPSGNVSSIRKSLAIETSSSSSSYFMSSLMSTTEPVNPNTNTDVACSSATTNECDISLCPSTTTIIGGGDNNPVVDEHFTQAKPEPKNNKTHIVKSDWFWYTIQNGYADELDYLFGDYLDSIANTPSCDRRDSLPITFNKRKRKRFSQRIQPEGTPIGSGKRRSSVSDAGLLSVSGSFLDCTTSPDKHESAKLVPEIEPTVESTTKNKSMRYNHFMDFFYTESNYVGILDTIVNLFKNPLESKADAETGDDALVNKSEVKAIFSNFIPIHEVHRQMLERLKELQTKWHDDCLIGQIILQHRNELIKAYPPYVNFFEQMKETLIQCDATNPRFHAFLKINQAKPECGRQSLQDLMIRPVQRLPSISLLLNDILKHTNKNNPDYKKLEEALKAIKEVMAHINEDKRKTEGQLAMFDIFNDIEGCPAHLVSSHRSFISKCEVTELSDTLSGRGDSLMLYLFSDTIEVCKKRSRGFNSAKSPSSTKSFKHIKLMPLGSIKFVIEICDSPRGFAISCRHNQDNKDKLYSFIMVDEETDRGVYLRSLCKQMAENACRTDTDKALISMTSQELDVDITDVNLSTLSKAFKFATRTRLKVGRAFSFNKTPSKLKRAVSTMMPSPFGSTNSLTPASQLAQMRLASCTNINEVGEEEDHSRQGSPSAQSEILLAPMSVQPTRKAKSSTISMAALRRL